MRFVTAASLVLYLAAQAPADDHQTYTDHTDPTYLLDKSGAKRAIQTQQEWALRRQQVIRGIETVMGPLPRPEKPVPLNVKILEEEALADGLVRQKIEYHTDSLSRVVRAYLFIPKGQERKAAVLCLHQTIGIGKGEPAGLGGSPNLQYALHLAQRNFVTLAPDYPSFGDSQGYDFPAQDGYISGSMQAVYDNIRAVDLLQALEQVDGERIGCIGHSLGGHNTMFTAVFEPRIKALVSNCGFTRFHKYYEGDLAGWTSARYMPLIASKYHNNPDLVPFDFPEIVAAFAPRPFLASAPISDSNFDVKGVQETIAKAKPIYDLFEAGENLQSNYPDCKHDFPETVREVAYVFLAQHLRGDVPVLFDSVASPAPVE